MQIEHDTFVVVADGEKMLFFRNAGDAVYPKLELETGQEERNPPDREIKSDAAGRSHNGGGAGGGSLGTTDYHEQEEQRFAANAAALLKQRALASDYEKLIVVAPPSTLGELRKHYHPEVKNRLVGELAKDLTNHPVDQIEKVISAA